MLGQATARLDNFNKVVGIDPSAPMIQAALEENAKSSLSTKDRINFIQGNAEDLSGILEDNSVDMLVSGSSLLPLSVPAALTNTM